MRGFLLHLLRHGAPETPGLLMGRTDGPPTRAGIDACVARAADLGVDAILSSGLARARDAAEAIARHHGRAAAIDSRWRELDFGEWDGLAPAHIEPSALSRFRQDPDACPPPGGERWSALVARVAEAIVDIDASSTLVVTHGGAMRAALAHLCGFTQPQFWAFDLSYSALLTLKVWRAPQPSAQIVGLRS